MKRFLAALLCCFLLLNCIPLASFAETESPGVSVPVTSVVVTAPVNATEQTEDDAILAVEGTLLLAAQVQPDDAFNKEVVWSSSDETIATVDATGTVTAVSAGEAVIRATAADGSQAYGELPVTVTAPVPPVEAPVTAASPNATNPTDPVDPTTPTDPVDPTNPTDPVDTTNPTDPADPTNPTDPVDPTNPTDPVDPTNPTDPADTTNPTDPVDPANPTDPAAPVLVTGITVTGQDGAVTLQAPGTLQMLAAVTPENAANPAVTWSLPEGTVCATIDAVTGLLTGVSAGTVSVTATAADGSGVTGSATIEILPAPAAFEGAGTVESPFLIGTPEALTQLAALVNAGDPLYTGAHYRQTAPLSLSGTVWTPIGTLDNPFTGTFDGAGQGFSGLSGGSGSGWFGLFGVTNGATVSGIAMAEVSLSLSGAYAGAGAVIGKMQGGTLQKSYIAGRIITDFPDGPTGGLVGLLSGGTVENCFNGAKIVGNGFTGGIVGSAEGAASIASCYGIGFVASRNAEYGLVAGQYAAGAIASGCCAVSGYDPSAASVAWTDGGSAASFPGFDFAGVWAMGSGPYYPFPVLQICPFAGDESWVLDTAERPAGYQGNDITYPGKSSPRAFRAADASLPSSYRFDETTYTLDVDDLPPIRNQESTGTCWAHAIIAAAEIGVNKNANYSELQLAWFHHRGPKKADGTYNDPLNNFGGDYNGYGYEDPWGGDNYQFASKTVASWMGVSQEDSTTAFSMENAAAIVQNGGLSYSYAFEKDAAHLDQVRVIPLTQTDDIKKAIRDYGCVTIDYKSDTRYYRYSTDGYFFYDPDTSDPLYTNHAVAIVGWVDNMSRTNFNQPYPANNGAWIVRNSYGSSWSSGAGGYFYMSYDCKLLQQASAEAFVWEFSAAASGERCYQYDGSSSLYYYSTYSQAPSVANVFEAQESESIQAVSFWMDRTANVDYTIEVYTNITGTSSPVSGTLAATKSDQTGFGGYYRIRLDTPVFVQKGTKFSVVLKIQNPDQHHLLIPFDIDGANSYYWFHAYSQPGQSFVDYGGGGGWRSSNGNCRIKAFTNDLRVSAITVTSPANYLIAQVGATLQMSAEITPDNAVDPSVTWSVDDDAFATISNAGLLTLSTGSAGSVTVTATANDGSGVTGTKVITVTAADPATDDYAVTVDRAGITDDPTLFIDGVEYDEAELFVSGTKSTKVMPDGTAKCVTTYAYDINDETDPHKNYPTGMTVWSLSYVTDDQGNGEYVPTRVNSLDNLLRYSGSSIRITGEKGIRMITSVATSTKAALTSAGLDGYTLMEYGTLVAWWHDELNDGANPLVLGESYVKSAYAYKRGVADPIFNLSGGLTQYTNVLVGFTNDQCIPDLAMRPYAILRGPDGQTVTIYGGVILRSIGYIAYQNRNAFARGSAAYNYIWQIIRHVYGNQYG